MNEPAAEEEKHEEDAQFDAEWNRAAEEARLAEEAEQQRQYGEDAASLDRFMAEQAAANAAEEAHYQEHLRFQELERRHQEKLDAALAAQMAANEKFVSEITSKLESVRSQPAPSSSPITLNEISALFKQKIDELNISNLSAVGTPDVVTHSDLRQTLDRRDEDLKNYFTATIDEKNATIESKLDAILASTTTPTARRNLSTEPAFRGTRVNIDPLHHPNSRFASKRFDSGGDDNSNLDEDDEEASQRQPRRTPPKSPYIKGYMLGQSPLTDPRRGKANDLYLWGEDGAPYPQDIASEEFLMSLGFDVDVMDEVVAVCYDLLDNWMDPNVKPKDYDYAFHKLKTVTPADFVDWYTHLCYELRRYNIALLPFDCILLKWANVGLCPPGVGARKYLAMARALFPILDKLLPKSNPTVLECIHQLSGFQHDGYKLLDSVMARILPVFCEQLSIHPPNWSDYGNIIEMQRQ
jgi:hypothetical protein